MKMTYRSEYALLALVYLSRHHQAAYIPAERIAQAQGIPQKFLEQLLLSLRRAKYLHSSKGCNGGYCLARPAESINLAEIIRLFDGALAPTDSVSNTFHSSTPIEREIGLVRVFRDIRDYVALKLETTTLADLGKNPTKEIDDSSK
jgi:Rrf2 family cysteine metabolism transcriptional repressor